MPPTTDLCHIDTSRKVRLEISLRDTGGNSVDLEEIVKQLVDYLTDAIGEDGANEVKSKVLPLCSNTALLVLGRALPQQYQVLFADPQARVALSLLAGVSFSLLKFMQTNSLQVHTKETQLTDQELRDIQTADRVSSFAVLASTLGIDPERLIQVLVEAGAISQEVANSLGVQAAPTQNPPEGSCPPGRN